MSDADVVALINKDGDRLAVWHIVIGPEWPMSRLAGAWVDVIAPALYVRRFLIPFGGCLPNDLAHLESDSAGVIDPNATRGAIAARISELEVLHKNSPTKAGKPRAPIPWPRLPARLDWDDLPHPPRGVVADPLTSQTIAVARWVADLATAWSNVETNRLSRDHLAGQESVAQAMPVVLAGAKRA